MQKVLDWIRNNKTGVTLLAVAVVLATLGGCLRLSDLIPVRVPLEVQKGLGVPGTVPLTDAERVFKAWAAAGEQFAENIEGGWQVVGALQGLFDAGMLAGANAFPGAALLFPALTGIAGLFIKGPGTAKEKQASYNKGLEVGRRLAEGLVGRSE